MNTDKLAWFSQSLTLSFVISDELSSMGYPGLGGEGNCTAYPLYCQESELRCVQNHIAEILKRREHVLEKCLQLQVNSRILSRESRQDLVIAIDEGGALVQSMLSGEVADMFEWFAKKEREKKRTELNGAASNLELP